MPRFVPFVPFVPSLGARRPPVAAVVLAVASLVAASCGSGGTGRAASPTTGTETVQAGAARPSSGCAHATRAPRSGRHALTVAGRTRTYQLSVPPDRDPHRPAPLILLFHGFSGDGARIVALTRLPARAARTGAIVVAPDGTNHTWELGARSADAAFVDALVDSIAATTCVDLQRVYATGFSAGAAFTIIYSCARQDRIAAIATVAVDFQLGCHRPMPILAFHGTKDPAVPYDDGAVGASLPGVEVRGTELNLRDWARLDGCRTTPDDHVMGSQVTRQTWPHCDAGTEVVLYRVDGGGHSWPGAPPGGGAGLTTEQIDASALIVAFFAAHHLAAPR